MVPQVYFVFSGKIISTGIYLQSLNCTRKGNKREHDIAGTDVPGQGEKRRTGLKTGLAGIWPFRAVPVPSK